MALADIIKKIEADAQQEAERIVSDAKTRMREIESEGATATKAFEEQAKRDRERRAGKAAERIISAARHEAKFIRESFKNNLIDEVFAAVEKKLTDLSDDAYRTYITQSIEHMGDAVHEATYRVASEHEKETVALLTKAGASSDAITVVPEGVLHGGFVAETPRQEFDFSFASLIKQARLEKEIAVSRELFA